MRSAPLNAVTGNIAGHVLANDDDMLKLDGVGVWGAQRILALVGLPRRGSAGRACARLGRAELAGLPMAMAGVPALAGWKIRR